MRIMMITSTTYTITSISITKCVLGPGFGLDDAPVVCADLKRLGNIMIEQQRATVTLPVTV